MPIRHREAGPRLLSAESSTPTPPRTHRPRIDVLDGIRGIAIALVVAFHAGFAPGGGIGVTIFFVLSGYLITGILIKPAILSRPGLMRFWVRRLLRLFPALLAVCIFCAVWGLLVVRGHARHLLFAEVLTSLTYTQDFYLGHGRSTADFGYLGQTWSLAVEQQFYLLWPLLLMGILRFARSWRTQVAVTLACALAFTLWRAHLAAAGLNAHLALNIDGQGDSLLVGCALALAMPHIGEVLACRQRLLDTGALVALALIAMFGLVDLNRPSPGRSGYLLIALASAVLIVRLLTRPATATSQLLERAFSWRPLVWLGLISYSVYLWHPVIFKIATDDIGLTSWPEKIAGSPLLGSSHPGDLVGLLPLDRAALPEAPQPAHAGQWPVRGGRPGCTRSAAGAPRTRPGAGSDRPARRRRARRVARSCRVRHGSRSRTPASSRSGAELRGGMGRAGTRRPARRTAFWPPARPGSPSSR